MTETVPIEQFAPRIEKILSKLAEKSAKHVGKKAADMPRRFLKAALAFYPSVLRVRTGRLRKSFEPFGRISQNKYELGLRSKVEYAKIQHWGGRTPAHEIRPKHKKALFWPGAKHPVKSVQHPGSDIKPTYFFRDPMKVEANKVIGELKKEIGF